MATAFSPKCVGENVLCWLNEGTINSKVNDTSKVVYLPISKLHSILTVANLLTHDNITISYYVHVNSLRLKSS